ncbi:sodium-coupled monocarboxylate transporter 2-like [Photinus pyralis]|uniref:sodium-coupled monocarboxylate transporter 2-like n=1 Tax=Photinus pyralis TaxID=7054 RepID=UPI0012676D89|nr:sodium-coupled monocarboxylate transporter 2-like [Photinus pyralis]
MCLSGIALGYIAGRSGVRPLAEIISMFDVIDYLIFCGVQFLTLCFGFLKNPNGTHPGNAGVCPVALSLVASQISGFTILGQSSDVYVYGANSAWMSLSIFLASLIGYFAFLPVLTELKSPNVLEYFELRFSRRIKTMATYVTILQGFVYSAILAYIPSIAVSQATGINPRIITMVLCTICVCCTVIGNFKAGICMDALQTLGITLVLVTVVFIGVTSLEGIHVVLEKAIHGNRFDFNFSFDLTQRDGFWQMMLGSTTLWLFTVSFQPGSVRKYTTLSTHADMKKVLFLQCCGVAVITLLSVFNGIIMYAKYENCDPISAGEIAGMDEMLPFFVMDVSKDVRGLSSVFAAIIFSAALSTLISMFNTQAVTIYGEIVAALLPTRFLKKGFIVKLLVIFSGLMCLVLTLYLEHMGGLFAFCYASMGLAFGLYVGLYTLGIVFPSANSKGALFGALSAIFVIGPIVVLNRSYGRRGMDQSFAQPVSVDGCAVFHNMSYSRTTPEQPFVLFRLSFWYNSVMSSLMVIAVGLLISWFTSPDPVIIPSSMFSPILRFTRTKTSKVQNSVQDYVPVHGDENTYKNGIK